MWLALYLPNLPLQVFQRAAPDTQPLAVAESRAAARRVVAANGAAQRCGVHAGLGVASALALAPELAVRPRNPRAEEEALQEIAAWALQFTPGVSLDAPACVLLEIAASLRLFGGMDALLQRIGQGSRELGYAVETAAAPTPRAARWLARAGHPVLIRDPESLPLGAGAPAAGSAGCRPGDGGNVVLHRRGHHRRLSAIAPGGPCPPRRSGPHPVPRPGPGTPA